MDQPFIAGHISSSSSQLAGDGGAGFGSISAAALAAGKRSIQSATQSTQNAQNTGIPPADDNEDTTEDAEADADVPAPASATSAPPPADRHAANYELECIRLRQKLNLSVRR
eukprot:3563815-Pleurochrysis_carterae.AAC.1